MIELFDFFTQSGESDPTVPELTPFAAALDAQSGRPVNQTHAGVGRVLVLATLSSGAEGLNLAFGQEVGVGVGNLDPAHQPAHPTHAQRPGEGGVPIDVDSCRTG